MTESLTHKATPVQVESANSGKTGSHKAKETLSLFASAILPIVGALGTLSVFLIANYYVGDVEINPGASFQSLEVHAYNKKGQEAVFHTPHFQLMPDNYHFEIILDSTAKQHADASVRFREKTLLQVKAPAQPNAAVYGQANSVKKKHWWQAWKKPPVDNNSAGGATAKGSNEK